MKILAIQNIGCETLGTFERLFEHDNFVVDTVIATDDRLPSSVQEYDGIVILGGPVSVYDNREYLKHEQEIIRSAVRREMPVLGICLGSQLIAQAMGGKVYRGKKKEIGWGKVALTREGSSDLFSGLGRGEILVFQWHGDTYSLPPSAKILASNALYPQAFRIGSAAGIQFHLEVDEKMVRRWAREYKDEMGSEGISLSDIIPTKEKSATLESECGIVYGNFVSALKSRVN